MTGFALLTVVGSVSLPIAQAVNRTIMASVDRIAPLIFMFPPYGVTGISSILRMK